MSTATIEERLTRLEEEVIELRSEVQRRKKFRTVEDTFGMFANCPDYDDVVRLGAEYRQRDRERTREALSKGQK